MLCVCRARSRRCCALAPWPPHGLWKASAQHGGMACFQVLRGGVQCGPVTSLYTAWSGCATRV
eukprot:6292841-Amphidinium_carterae.1